MLTDAYCFGYFYRHIHSTISAPVYQNGFFVIFVILQQCYFIKYIMYCNNVTINPKKLCRILFGCYSHLYPCKHAGINGEVSVWRRKWENFLKSNGKNFVRESPILFLWEWMPENWTGTSNGWIWKILNNCIFFNIVKPEIVNHSVGKGKIRYYYDDTW